MLLHAEGKEEQNQQQLTLNRTNIPTCFQNPKTIEKNLRKLRKPWKNPKPSKTIHYLKPTTCDLRTISFAESAGEIDVNAPWTAWTETCAEISEGREEAEGSGGGWEQVVAVSCLNVFLLCKWHHAVPVCF